MFESALYTPLPQVFVLCWWFCMLTTLKVTSRALDSKMFARDEHLFLSHENRSTSFEISNSKRISSCPLCGSHEHNFWWYWGPFFVIKSYDMNYDASVHTKLVSRVKVPIVPSGWNLVYPILTGLDLYYLSEVMWFANDDAIDACQVRVKCESFSRAT